MHFIHCIFLKKISSLIKNSKKIKLLFVFENKFFFFFAFTLTEKNLKNGFEFSERFRIVLYINCKFLCIVRGSSRKKLGPKTDPSQKSATLKHSLHKNWWPENGPFTKIKDLKMNRKIKNYNVIFFIIVLLQMILLGNNWKILLNRFFSQINILGWKSFFVEMRIYFAHFFKVRY